VVDALRSGAGAAEAADRAVEGTEAQHDNNATVEYREHLARVLVRRALEESGLA
jgi:carbon-monoxide dehydrogenase medium subunit